MANLRFRYETGGFSTAFSLQHVGKQYIDNSENERQNSAVRSAVDFVDKIVNKYTVANLNLQYQLQSFIGFRNILISIYINNLFDSMYEYAGHIGYDDGLPRWFPAATRNFFASIKVNL
jgi:outer membrane receptor protein involved in Fe transport